MHGRRMRLRRLYEADDPGAGPGGGWPYHTGVPPNTPPDREGYRAAEGRGRSTVTPSPGPAGHDDGSPSQVQVGMHLATPGDAARLGGVEHRLDALEALVRRADDGVVRAEVHARSQDGAVAALHDRVREIEARGASRDGSARRAALDGDRLAGRIDGVEQASQRRHDEAVQLHQQQVTRVEEHARRLAEQARESSQQHSTQQLGEALGQVRGQLAKELDGVAARARAQHDAQVQHATRTDEALAALGAAAQQHTADHQELRHRLAEQHQTADAAVRHLRDALADGMAQLRQSMDQQAQRDRAAREREAAERVKADAARDAALLQRCADTVVGQIGAELRRAQDFAETATQRMDAIEELLKAEIRSRMELGAAAERTQEEVRRVERAGLAAQSSLEGQVSTRVADVHAALQAHQVSARDALTAAHDGLRDSFQQQLREASKEWGEARAALAARCDAAEQGLADAGARDTAAEFRTADAERAISELRGLQEREGHELRGLVTRAENRWEEELRGAQKSTTEWMQSQFATASREAAAREAHVKEFAAQETARLSDGLLAQASEHERAMVEAKRAQLRAQHEISAEVQAVADRVGEVAKDAGLHAEDVAQKAREERAHMSMQHELLAQKVAQVADGLAAGLQAVRDEAVEAQRSLSAREQQQERRARELAEQRTARERERDDEAARQLGSEQQRRERSLRELEQELRRVERALGDRAEATATAQQQQHVAAAEAMAEARGEARRAAADLQSQLRALQEHAERQAGEVDSGARAAAADLRAQLAAATQELRQEVTAAAATGDERHAAAARRDEERERREKEREERRAAADADVERRLQEHATAARERERWQHDADRRAEELRRAAEQQQRAAAAQSDELRQGLERLTRQTGDDQQSTNASIEMLSELVRANAESVREDIAGELSAQFDEHGRRAGDAHRASKESHDAARRYAEQLHHAAVAAQQQSDARHAERLAQLAQRSSALEARHDAAQAQWESTIDGRLQAQDARWEERRLKQDERIAAAERAGATAADDARGAAARAAAADERQSQRADGVKGQLTERLDAAERWRDAAEGRLRRAEDALEERRREVGQEREGRAADGAALVQRLEEQRAGLESLRRVVTRLDDTRGEERDEARQSSGRAAGDIAALQEQARRQEEWARKATTRMQAIEEEEQTRKTGDAAWDEWQKSADRRLKELKEGLPARPAAPADGDAAAADASQEQARKEAQEQARKEAQEAAAKDAREAQEKAQAGIDAVEKSVAGIAARVEEIGAGWVAGAEEPARRGVEALEQVARTALGHAELGPSRKSLEASEEMHQRLMAQDGQIQDMRDDLAEKITEIGMQISQFAAAEAGEVDSEDGGKGAPPVPAGNLESGPGGPLPG